MGKFYTVILVVCILVSKISAQDTLNLLPPAELQAINQGTAVQLAWQAPIDTLASPDTIPLGLIGYRIYSNNELIGYSVHPILSYFDTDPDIPVDFYRVTAVYDLSFYGFPGDTAESLPSNLAFVITDINYINHLPFTEEFTTGIFETNLWTAEGNWRIAGQLGNPAPAGEFYYNPIVTGYSASLTSWWMDATGYTDGQIYLDFDLKLNSLNLSGTENLYLDIFNGEQWIEQERYSNISGIDWLNEKIDITDHAFGKPFMIRFRAEGTSTANILNWLLDNIKIYRECLKPTNLVTSLPHPMYEPCIMLLEWDSPMNNGQGTNQWISWNSGTNNDGIGLTGGGSFLMAIRFIPAQLAEFHNFYLTSIKLFPYESGATLILKAWTGANASQLVVSQPVASYVSGQWNEFPLSIPFQINGNDELWIGYQVIHPSGIEPVGVDAGPAVAGFGDMISLDGSVWESMSQAYGGDYNWNIEGFLTDELNRSLVEYHIFRDDEYRGSTTDDFYFDDFTGVDWPCYHVTAVYNDCESEPSNIACMPGTQNPCYIGVKDIPLNTLEIYPNPASSFITVSLSGEINNLILTDITGRKHQEYTIKEGTEDFPVDVNELPQGMYIFRFITKSGISGAKKMLIAR